MRVPRAQERRQFRVRGWMIAAVVILLVLLFSLRGLAGFYTDYLWFDSLSQGDTWSKLLGAKFVPAFVFTIVFFGILFANLLVADRLAPRFRSSANPTPEDELVQRYQETTARYHGRIRVGVSLFFALIAGIGVSSQWREWILFTNRVDFGRSDPQFDRDIGFYVFELPFIQFILDWLFAGLVIMLLVTAAAHYLNGGIRFQTAGQRATPQVKAHLSVILALMALVKTAQYYFGRFELNFSNRGVVDGASYTDVKAQLPALDLLVFISIVAAGLFLWNIWRRGWVLPVIAVGLWGFISLVVGTIYPAGVQNFKVKPNEFANEQAYIRRNIRATRDAFNLSSVKTQPFRFKELEQGVAEANQTTIQNARLWDPAVIRSTYQTLQGLQTYYRISDADIDRYTVDGEVTQTLIAARDLNSAELPSQSWVNEHLVYTHGYGAVASPTNRAKSNGEPVFFLSDVPTRSNGIELSGKGSRVYFGEGLDNFSIVNAKQSEFDFARQGRSDATTRYDGKDGIELSNIVKRAAFALRFGDFNPLISGQVTSDSKVLMIRDIRERVEKLAPFLEFDADPYPVVTDGKLQWILDGYTTSDRYPYSQSQAGRGGLTGDFNYVRNSVKATVDAYEGTVTFYVIDRKDPVIKAYRQAFPDLFTSFSEMPRELREHLRYPEDLMKVQSEVYAKYHVTEPRRFYQGTERWLLTPDPNDAVPIATGTAPQARDNTGRAPEISATTARQDPYYLYIRLPSDPTPTPSFLILQPFVPVSKDNQQTRLVSFLTAKSDPRNYGRLEALVMPQGEQVLGPVQVAANINKDPVIAQQFTLIDQRGSQIVKGNVQLIPIGESIVYVQPIFTIAEQGPNPFPQLSFVAVFTQGRDPVLASTVQDGIDQLFGAAPTDPNEPTEPTEPTDDTAAELLDRAEQKFADAEQALTDGDLGRYQELVQEAGDLVRQAQARLEAAGGDGSGDGSGGSSTTTTTPSTTTTTNPSADAQALAVAPGGRSGA